MIYERDFSGYGDESPLSDGGKWTNPASNNLNAQCKSGVVCGTGKNSGINDSCRILSGFGADVDVTATLWFKSPVDDYSHENELLFRMLNGAGNYLRGYEVLFEDDNGSGALQAYVVSWDGSGSYHVFSESGQASVSYPTTVRARMVGPLIDVWLAGVWKFQQDVRADSQSELTGGNPGVGFYSAGGASPGADPQSGFTYYKADDGQAVVIPERRIIYRGA